MTTLSEVGRRLSAAEATLRGIAAKVVTFATQAYVDASQKATPRVLSSGPQTAVLFDAIEYSGTWTLTLPPLATSQGGFIMLINTDSGAGTLTVDGDGAEEIEGAATQAWSTSGAKVTLYAGTTQWWVFGTGAD